VVARAQLDTDTANLEAEARNVAALEAQIERKLVRAPFGGRLGIREVDVGEYLAPGTRLTVLEALGGVFVDFTLPQSELGKVQPGMAVQAVLEGALEKEAKAMKGVVSAVEPALDPATRSIKLRASLENADDRLRPGMFVSVKVLMPRRTDVVTVPATAVVHASYGDSVFVIENKKPGSPGMAKSPSGKPVKVARQQFVRLGDARGDLLAVAEGVKPGQEVVSAGAFKLRNGAPVVVDNRVKPDPELAPRPENR
jgi:membrane fusion protein (multidrug efflux system)